MSIEVVSFGETMAMVAPIQASSLLDAQTFQINPGGAESNVAMYLSSLGHSTAWVSRLGDDPLGHLILRYVAAAGVDTSSVEMDQSHRTGVFFKDPTPEGTRVFYYRENSAASQSGLSILEKIHSHRPSIIHLTGITPALSPQCDGLIERLMENRLEGSPLVSFDVNFRPGLWSREIAATRLLELAQAADIVFVGMDEATEIWRTTGSDEVRQLLNRPPVVVVKNGGIGATCYHGGDSTYVATPRSNIVELIGAGDAFASGWLSGYLQGRSHEERLRLGHLVASVAMQSTADHRPLPSWDWLQPAIRVADNEWHGVLETQHTSHVNG